MSDRFSRGEVLRNLLSTTYVQIGSRPFALSAFAALHRVGAGEARTLLQTAETAGWVTSQADYYQLTEEGISTCMA